MSISRRAKVRRGEPQRETGAGFNVDAFKQRINKWWRDVEKLKKTNVSLDPALSASKARLLSKALSIKRAIDKIPGIDKLGLGDLAALPLIPIGIAGGILVWITNWYTDYAKFDRSHELYLKLRQEGKSPEEAANIVDKVRGESPSLFGNITKLAIPIAVLGAAFLFFRSRRNDS